MKEKISVLEEKGFRIYWKGEWPKKNKHGSETQVPPHELAKAPPKRKP